MAAKQPQSEDSTAGGKQSREDIPLEEQAVVEEPCVHVHTDDGESLIPVEDMEDYLCAVATEIRMGVCDHEDTFMFINPAVEFEEGENNPLDTIN